MKLNLRLTGDGNKSGKIYIYIYVSLSFFVLDRIHTKWVCLEGSKVG